jgi:hypothetical protein
MPRKRHKPEEIAAKLTQVDALVSQEQDPSTPALNEYSTWTA